MRILSKELFYKLNLCGGSPSLIVGFSLRLLTHPTMVIVGQEVLHKLPLHINHIGRLDELSLILVVHPASLHIPKLQIKPLIAFYDT